MAITTPTNPLSSNLPVPQGPWIDSSNGLPTLAFRLFITGILGRLGGASGNGTTSWDGEFQQALELGVLEDLEDGASTQLSFDFGDDPHALPQPLDPFFPDAPIPPPVSLGPLFDYEAPSPQNAALKAALLLADDPIRPTA